MQVPLSPQDDLPTSIDEWRRLQGELDRASVRAIQWTRGANEIAGLQREGQ